MTTTITLATRFQYEPNWLEALQNESSELLDVDVDTEVGRRCSALMLRTNALLLEMPDIDPEQHDDILNAAAHQCCVWLHG